MTEPSSRERHFLSLWQSLGLPEQPQQQFRFHPTRRWRFDFAWPELRVAVEIQGGEFRRGRHGRGKGLRSDAEKFRAAARLGWFLLPIAGTELDQRPKQVMDDVREVLLQRLIRHPTN